MNAATETLVDGRAVHDKPGAMDKLMEELTELAAQRTKLVSHHGHAMVDRDGVTDITTRLRHGDIVEAIGEIEGDARLIVIGKRGEAGHRKGLGHARALLKAAGINAATRVPEGRPEEVLGKLIEAEGFDMLVMGACGHSRIRSLVIGSTTTEMMRSCKVPVVLVR